MKTRIITWNMQGGGTASSANASLPEKVDFLMNEAKTDRYNIICLQEIGTRSTSLFAPYYHMFAPSPTNPYQGIFNYKGRSFYACFQEDIVASVTRCTTAILCDKVDMLPALKPKFSLGRPSTNSRPFLIAAIGKANVACAHCTANSSVSPAELREFAKTFFTAAPDCDNVIAGDFNQSPDDAKRDPVAKANNLYPLDLHTLKSAADAKAYVAASNTFTQGAAGARNSLLDFYILAKRIYTRESATCFIRNVSTVSPVKNYSDHNLQALELNLDF